jgi:hypothetical protein
VSVHRCCEAVASGSKTAPLSAGFRAGSLHLRALVRRGFDIAGWLLPGAILVLIPKCPVCVAAYVAAVSGLGLSLTTAAHLRMALVILCVTSLAYLVARGLSGSPLFQRLLNPPMATGETPGRRVP